MVSFVRIIKKIPMQNKLRFSSFCFLLLFVHSIELFAHVSQYNFSQRQDTIPKLNSGTLLYDPHGNATVYYGSTAGNSGVVYPNNFIFSGIPIGFNFVFNGETQTTFAINSRGYLQLGFGAINMQVSPDINPISGTSTSNIISALGGNLVATNNTLLRYALLGTAPNRILAVQWENMARRFSSNIDSLTFQIRLHETTNNIEIVYNKLFIPKQGSDQFFEIGLKGILAGDYFNRELLQSWAYTRIGHSKNSACLLGKYNYPPAGTCFTFSPSEPVCSGLIPTAFASASSYSAVNGAEIGLTLDSVTVSKYTYFEWQQSADDSNWTAIASDTLRICNIVQHASTYYRCKISCASSVVYSNSIFITQLSNIDPYCTGSYARYPNVINIGNVSISNLNNGNASPALSQSLFSSYTDFSYLPAVNLMQGGNYEITLKEIFKTSYIKSGVMVFVDFNHDGFFTAPLEEFFIGKTKSTVNGYVAKSALQIPDSALTGYTKMRIVLYDPNTQLPVNACDPSFYGETEDYVVNITPFQSCNTVPDTVYTAASVTAACNDASIKLFLVANLSSGFNYQWYTSTDSINWTKIQGATQNSLTATQSQLSFYKCRINCQSLDTVFSIPVKVDNSDFYFCYCDSRAINPSDLQIGSVRLTNLYNESGSKIKLYSNYTTVTPARLDRNGKYSLTVSQKFISNYSGGANIMAFIDFDGNGVFGNKSNEIINLGATSSSVFPNNVVSAVFTVPDSAHLGLSGMRIALGEFTTINYATACGIFNHGEVEDYLVNITMADSCVFPVAGGITIAQDSAICANQLAHLTLSGINYSPSYQYQWQTSIDSLNWVDAAGADYFTLAIVQNVKTYYRCRVSCSGNDAYSLPVSVGIKNFLNCFCYSSPNWNDYTDIGNIKIAGFNYGKDTLAVNSFGGNNYVDFTDSLPAIGLEEGGIYQMKITAAKTSFSPIQCKAYVYIDFNGSGTFDANEIFVTPAFNTAVPSSASVQIIVPQNITYTGYTRMRVILLNSYYTLPFTQAACGYYQNYSGETQDYLVNISHAVPCQPLVNGLLNADKPQYCNGDNMTLNYSGNTYQSLLNYIWQNSSDSVTWTTIDTTRLPAQSFSVNSSIYYRCIPYCAAERDTAYYKIIFKPFYRCYCASTVSAINYLDIGNIKIAGYNYGKDTIQANPYVLNTYSDFTDSLPPIILQHSGTYPMTLFAARKPTFTTTPRASVYIDYNHNGIFEFAESYSVSNFSYNFPCVATFNLILPTNALMGLTRMRIVLGVYNYFGPISPCGISYQYGETEDYLVNIIPPLPCTSLGATQSISASPTTTCFGNLITLTSSAYSYQPLLKYIWQSSFDNQNWTTVDTTTLPIINYFMGLTKYYRCVANCLSLGDTSVSVLITQTPFLNCYCTSSVTQAAKLDIGNIQIAGYNYGADTLQVNPIVNNAYSNFFNSRPPIILERGGLYPIKVVAAKSNVHPYPANANVYIDYNQTGKFDSDETFYITDFSANFPYYGSTQIYIPTTAQVGLTRMRVALAGGDILITNGPPPCGINATYGETEDYAVSIIDPLPCQSLQAGTISSSTTKTCINSLVTLSYAGNPYQASMRYCWQSSPDSLQWSSLDTTNYLNYTFSIGSNAFFRCIAFCSTESDTTAGIKINFEPYYNCYCTSGVNSTSYIDIGNIKIAGYNYGSDTLQINPTANQSYTDFSNSLPPISLERSGNYPMDITAAKSISYNNNSNAAVYIDFNHNGIFDNNEKTVINNFSSIFPFVGSTVINIPSSALLGLTRMRVVLNAGGNYFSGPPPCGLNYYFGETEDYLVDILTEKTCPTLWSHGHLSSKDSSICPTQIFKLKYEGNPYQGAFSYTWQYSSNAVNWITVPGTYYNEYSSNLISPTYYRCIVSCGTFVDTTAAVLLSLKSFNLCYCSSAAADTAFLDIGNFQLAGFSYGTDSLLINPNATHTYSDFTSLPPIVVEKGGHYPAIITCALTSHQQTGFSAIMYVDYNHNGYFDTNESFWVSGFSTTLPYYGIRTMDIPTSAQLGITRIRIVLVSGINVNSTFDACSIYQYGETEDYLLNIINPLPCQPLQKGNVKILNKSICAYQPFSFIYTGNTYHTQFNYVWQCLTNGTTWNNCSSYSSSPIFNSYYYPTWTAIRCIASCGAFSDTSAHFLLAPASFYHCYCQSIYSTSVNQDIGNVNLHTLNNGNPIPFLNNPLAFGSYTDYTYLTPVELTQGFVYPLSVTQINSGSFHRSKVKAYFDFNKDGDFDDANEAFFVGVSADTGSQPGKMTCNIAVPVTAALGITGMRITLNEKYKTDEVYPCNSQHYPWGETEDYLVIINANTNCALPIAGNAFSPLSRYCAGDSALLRLVNNLPINGESYQWQISIDSLNWTDIGQVKSFDERLLPVTAPRYYRCAVSCGNLISYSSAVKLDLFSNSVCNYFCNDLGGSDCFWNDKITHVSIDGTSLDNADTTCYKANGNYHYTFPDMGNTTATLVRGAAYTLRVTSSKNTNISVWVDYNRDYLFSISEWANVTDSSVAGIPDTVRLNVPMNAALGKVRMRIRSRYAQHPNDLDNACTYFYSGETEDYVLTIDITNAVKTTLVDANVTVEPNPASESIYVHLKTALPDNIQLKLINAQGQQIYSETVKTNGTNCKKKINVSTFAKGIYILQVRNADQFLIKKVMIE